MAPIRSINGNSSQPAKNFACTDEYRAIYSTYQAKIHISVLTRRFFRSQNGQKCVGGRSLPRTQLRSLQRCPRPLAGLRGGIGKDKGGEAREGYGKGLQMRWMRGKGKLASGRPLSSFT